MGAGNAIEKLFRPLKPFFVHEGTEKPKFAWLMRWKLGQWEKNLKTSASEKYDADLLKARTDSTPTVAAAEAQKRYTDEIEEVAKRTKRLRVWKGAKWGVVALGLTSPIILMVGGEKLYDWVMNATGHNVGTGGQRAVDGALKETGVSTVLDKLQNNQYPGADNPNNGSATHAPIPSDSAPKSPTISADFAHPSIVSSDGAPYVVLSDAQFNGALESFSKGRVPKMDALVSQLTDDAKNRLDAGTNYKPAFRDPKNAYIIMDNKGHAGVLATVQGGSHNGQHVLIKATDYWQLITASKRSDLSAPSPTKLGAENPIGPSSGGSGHGASGDWGAPDGGGAPQSGGGESALGQMASMGADGVTAATYGRSGYDTLKTGKVLGDAGRAAIVAKDIKAGVEILKPIRLFGDNIPVVGALVAGTAGLITVGCDLAQGNYKAAAGDFVCGSIQTVAGFGGFFTSTIGDGISDAARQGMIKVGGDDFKEVSTSATWDTVKLAVNGAKAVGNFGAIEKQDMYAQKPAQTRWTMAAAARATTGNPEIGGTMIAGADQTANMSAPGYTTAARPGAAPGRAGAAPAAALHA